MSDTTTRTNAPTAAAPWWTRWRPAWHSAAACRGTNVEWFPTQGQSVAPAIAICTSCPVRPGCLADALADPALDFGIRGGMGARNRIKLRAAQRQAINEAASSADQQPAINDEHAATNTRSTAR